MTTKKTVDYVVGGLSAVFAAGAATMAYRKREDLGTALPLTAIGLACAGLASYSLLGTDDGLDRITDSKGRLWAIVPPGAQYRDDEGVLFGNLSKTETFYLREDAKGQIAWLWIPESSTIGRHSRRPIVACKSYYRATLGRDPSVQETKTLLSEETVVPGSGAVLLAPGKLARDGVDGDQFYFRMYDTTP